MQYEEFLEAVQRHAELDDATHALDATRATLETLAERLPGPESNDLAAQLPRELAHFLDRDASYTGEAFGVDEFCERVAARAGADRALGVRYAAAVMTTIERSVSSSSDDVRAQLPPDYGRLFEAARPPQP